MNKTNLFSVSSLLERRQSPILFLPVFGVVLDFSLKSFPKDWRALHSLTVTRCFLQFLGDGSRTPVFLRALRTQTPVFEVPVGLRGSLSLTQQERRREFDKGWA